MDNNNVYVELTLDHRSFSSAKTVIVAVSDYCEYLTTYKKLAVEKACKTLGLNENEVSVIDYSVLGRDVIIIN